ADPSLETAGEPVRLELVALAAARVPLELTLGRKRRDAELTAHAVCHVRGVDVASAIAITRAEELRLADGAQIVIKREGAVPAAVLMPLHRRDQEHRVRQEVVVRFSPVIEQQARQVVVFGTRNAALPEQLNHAVAARAMASAPLPHEFSANLWIGGLRRSDCCISQIVLA